MGNFAMKDILSRVLEHADSQPDAVCFTHVPLRDEETRCTYAQLAAQTAAAAGELGARGVGRGDIVVLVGTHHVDLFAAWLGAVWLGAVPTILAEPSVRIDATVYHDRLAELLERIDAKLIAHDPAYTISDFSDVEVCDLPSLAHGNQPPPERVIPAVEDLLLLQHSSGTTGLQKGVMLSHGVVIRHAAAYEEALDVNGNDVIASWLPLYHDMGFIACFIMPLYLGLPVVWLSPFEWVADPASLLVAIDRHRGTLAWLPNFAFTFLAQRVRAEPGTYDLSSLRLVINCSEPVSIEAMEAFRNRFVGDGLRENTVHTCYAMAENVFAVTASTPARLPRTIRIDQQTWQNDHRATASTADDALSMVSNGPPVPSCEIRILDDAGDPLSALTAGRVSIRSEFLFDGYFRREDLNDALFDRDGFYDTGDLGFVDAEGHLYVTGRKKDLVIVGGRNIYPQDVEQVAMQARGIHPGRVVCFGVTIPRLGTEGIVLLAESAEPEEERAEIAREVRRLCASQLDVNVTDIRIVARMSLRKSTSGKLARGGNREWYLDGRFGKLPKRFLES